MATGAGFTSGNARDGMKFLPDGVSMNVLGVILHVSSPRSWMLVEVLLLNSGPFKNFFPCNHFINK